MNRQFGAFGGLAMVLIVLNHAIELGFGYPERLGFGAQPEWVEAVRLVIQGLGVFAVPIFLFISGSFLAYAAQGDPPRITFKFLITSLRYILVPYVIWSILFYGVIFIHWQEVYSPIKYIKDLLVGYPFHFIPLLVAFYIMSPLLVRLAKNWPALLLALAGGYQLLLIVILNPNIFGFTLPAWAQYLAVPALKQTISEWGIFFPLGLVYGLHARSIQPFLRKITWVNVALTILLFSVAVLSGLRLLDFPIARYLAMVTFVLLMPVISRDQIPLVKRFERVGKRSYGLYLTHLITIDLFFLLVQLVYRPLVGWQIVMIPLMFVIGLALPVLLMETVAAGRGRKFYRYLFG